MDERIPAVLRQVAELEELGPNGATLEALGVATGLDGENLRALLGDAHAEHLVSFDVDRNVWQLESDGWASIETV